MTARLQHPFIMHAGHGSGPTWVARCLRTSIVSHGETPESAIRGLVDSILFAAQRDFESGRVLFSGHKQAPDNLWDRWHTVLAHGNCSALGRDLSLWSPARTAVVAGTATLSVDDSEEVGLMLQAAHLATQDPVEVLH